MEVVLLGTGTPNADPDRCGSGVALSRGASWLLVDCGRGVTQRALQAGLDLTDVAGVLLTHHHTDHVSDLATFATTRWTDGGHQPLIVVASEGPAARFADRCLEPFEDTAFHGQGPSDGGLRPRIEVRTFAATGRLSVVYTHDDWTVSSVLVDHHPIEAAVGYRIGDGRRTVAISGDTAVGAGVRQLAGGADVLIHEAVLTDRASASLLGWNASAQSVGALAAEAAVDTLVLTHLLPAPSSPGDIDAYVAETRQGGFVGDLILASDLVRFRVEG